MIRVVVLKRRWTLSVALRHKALCHSISFLTAASDTAQLHTAIQPHSCCEDTQEIQHFKCKQYKSAFPSRVKLSIV